MAAAALPRQFTPVPIRLGLSTMYDEKLNVALAKMVPEGLTLSFIWPNVPTATALVVTLRGPNAQLNCQVSYFPGSCGTLVFNNSSYSHAEHLSSMIALLEELAKLTGYSCVVYTTVPSQKDIIRVLEARGFASLQTFRSIRTANEITIWSKIVATL